MIYILQFMGIFLNLSYIGLLNSYSSKRHMNMSLFALRFVLNIDLV